MIKTIIISNFINATFRSELDSPRAGEARTDKIPVIPKAIDE
jgi:hypothetical protein